MAALRGRGVWVWRPRSVEQLTAFAVARRVQDVFVAVPPDIDQLPEHRGWLLELARAARGWGIALQALGDDSAWVDDPDAAVAWQQRAQRLGVFSGTHLDVEFWTRADFAHDPAGVTGRFVQVLARLRAAGPVECDVPWWLHEHRDHDGRRLDVAVLGSVDAVTALTYRTTLRGANGVLAVAEQVLAAGASTGTPVRLALDTTPPRPGEEHTSFHGRSERELDAVLQSVEVELGRRPAYVGTAVHDLDGWRALRSTV